MKNVLPTCSVSSSRQGCEFITGCVRTASFEDRAVASWSCKRFPPPLAGPSEFLSQIGPDEMFGHDGHLPCYAAITEGNVADVTIAQKLKLPKPQFVDVLLQHYTAPLEKTEDGNAQAYLLHTVASEQASVQLFDEAIAFEQRAIDASTGNMAENYERILAELKAKQKTVSKKASRN
jgi:hypothetical protein